MNYLLFYLKYFCIFAVDYMMLELHNVTIGQQIRGLSATVGEGNVLSITGSKGSGKTMLLRAVLGFLPVDEGHISIDGELVTPMSAPWFRKQMAYVPQYLVVPDDYHEVPTNYLSLLKRAVASGKPLLIVDEPSRTLNAEEMGLVDHLLQDAVQRGAIVLAVNSRITENKVQL